MYPSTGFLPKTHSLDSHSKHPPTCNDGKPITGHGSRYPILSNTGRRQNTRRKELRQRRDTHRFPISCFQSTIEHTTWISNRAQKEIDLALQSSLKTHVKVLQIPGKTVLFTSSAKRRDFQMQLFFSNWHFLYYYFRFPKNKTGTDSFMSILEVGFKTKKKDVNGRGFDNYTAREKYIVFICRLMAEVSCTAPWSTGTSPTWLLARPLSESKTHKKHTRKTVEEDIIHGVVKTNCRRRTTAIDGNLHREKNIGQRVKNKSKSLGND